MESDYFVVRGDTLDEAVAKIKAIKKENLVKLVVNNRVNEFVSNSADYSDDDLDPHGYGKRVPYIGWYWRPTDFVGRSIPIGDCGEFIGIMENNKWGYPERMLTEAEANQVIEVVWEAKRLSEKGGNLKEIWENTNGKLEELWDLFQGFKI